MLQYTIFPLGDKAITVELGNVISKAINEQVIVLSNYLQQQKIIGVKDVVPAYTTVTVVYDAYVIYQKHSQPYQFIKEQIENAVKEINRHFEVRAEKSYLNKFERFLVEQEPHLEMTQEKKSYKFLFAMIFLLVLI